MDAALSRVLARYPLSLDGAAAERATGGLIQTTWILTLGDGTRFVVQRMHPVFGPAVLEDIDAVTAHLVARGLETPRLVRTVAGELGVLDEGETWRVLTFVPGHTVDRVASPAMARAAGGMVARFHRALADLPHQFRFVRPGAHDTAAHLARLANLPAEGAVATLASEILAAGRALPPLPPVPPRVVHGDLKISNVLFDGDRARCLIDLDTCARMPLAYELGDAWRSWCNPLGEDVVETRFDPEIFAAAVAGYGAEGVTLEAVERDSLVTGLMTICVELAARFCVDAVEDRYFGWDPARFPSRKAHNEVRARGQLTLARAVAAREGELRGIVELASPPP